MSAETKETVSPLETSVGRRHCTGPVGKETGQNAIEKRFLSIPLRTRSAFLVYYRLFANKIFSFFLISECNR